MEWLACINALVACDNEDDDSAQITVGNVAFSEMFVSIKWLAYRITIIVRYNVYTMVPI